MTRSLNGGQKSWFQMFRRSSSWHVKSHERLSTVDSPGIFALLGTPLPKAVASRHRARRGVGRVAGGSRFVSRQYRSCGGRSRQVRNICSPTAHVSLVGSGVVCESCALVYHGVT